LPNRRRNAYREGTGSDDFVTIESPISDPAAALCAVGVRDADNGGTEDVTVMLTPLGG
jgi:hypothetical protein